MAAIRIFLEVDLESEFNVQSVFKERKGKKQNWKINNIKLWSIPWKQFIHYRVLCVKMLSQSCPAWSWNGRVFTPLPESVTGCGPSNGAGWPCEEALCSWSDPRRYHRGRLFTGSPAKQLGHPALRMSVCECISMFTTNVGCHEPLQICSLVQPLWRTIWNYLIEL